MASSKTVYFIRHGQSEHNVYEEAHCHEPDYHDPNLFDADLSSLGKQQITELPHAVASFHDDVELVVVSPLSRAIKTCLAAFNPNKKRILVNCSCREQVSNACDIGFPKATLMEQFPHLDFSLVASEVWWYRDAEAKQTVTAENYKEEWLHRRYEEPSSELMARITEFRAWLAVRPEKVIVVVGHSNFFKFYLGMSEKLKNCEVYKHQM